VHSEGRSVRLPTHPGMIMGVDRPSSRVVEKRVDARYDKMRRIPVAPDLFLIASNCGFPIFTL
jgi:hypothetical protein